MLSLSRRQGERIKIGDDITLIVLEIRGDQIRLGVDAHAGVRIDRAEVRRYTGPVSKFDQQRDKKEEPSPYLGAMPRPKRGDVELPDPRVQE